MFGLILKPFDKINNVIYRWTLRSPGVMGDRTRGLTDGAVRGKRLLNKEWIVTFALVDLT